VKKEKEESQGQRGKRIAIEMQQGTRHKKGPRVKKEKEESEGQRGKRVAIEMQQGTSAFLLVPFLSSYIFYLESSLCLVPCALCLLSYLCPPNMDTWLNQPLR